MILEKENALSHKIIGASINVHKILGGPGLLESIYEEALCHELSILGISHVRQQRIEVQYRNIIIKEPMFIDILVDNKVVIEVKATEKHNPVFESQILTYLRLTRLKLGLIVNFGSSHVKNGICRVINDIA